MVTKHPSAGERFQFPVCRRSQRSNVGEVGQFQEGEKVAAGNDQAGTSQQLTTANGQKKSPGPVLAITVP